MNPSEIAFRLRECVSLEEASTVLAFSIVKGVQSLDGAAFIDLMLELSYVLDYRFDIPEVLE